MVRELGERFGLGGLGVHVADTNGAFDSRVAGHG